MIKDYATTCVAAVNRVRDQIAPSFPEAPTMHAFIAR